jgi:hypothetical protein
MGTHDYFNVQELLTAIQGSKGLMDVIAKRLGCSWSTAQSYINRSEEAKQAFTDEREAYLDRVETKAMECIDAGSEQMIKFYLATIGKHRGFTEKSQIELSGNNPLIDAIKELK